MSDTPISDSTAHNVADLGMLCRRLERELTASNELIVRLQAVTNDPHALWVNWLRGTVSLPAGIGDVRQYQDRIKRLEEAGDKIVESGWSVQDWSGMCVVWAKAKEDKL